MRRRILHIIVLDRGDYRYYFFIFLLVSQLVPILSLSLLLSSSLSYYRRIRSVYIHIYCSKKRISITVYNIHSYIYIQEYTCTKSTYIQWRRLKATRVIKLFRVQITYYYVYKIPRPPAITIPPLSASPGRKIRN